SGFHAKSRTLSGGLAMARRSLVQCESRERSATASMTEDLLIGARDRLLSFAHQRFASDIDVVGLFLSGSLAAGTADAYSDIDLRVVVKPEKHGWFIEHRREIPTSWPDFLFNEWRPGTNHCVSHFRSFVKIDIFY